MHFDGDDMVLDCSGRREYAFGGPLGIGAGSFVSDDDIWVSFGADGGLGGVRDFTAEERAEIADAQIALWQRFKEGQ